MERRGVLSREIGMCMTINQPAETKKLPNGTPVMRVSPSTWQVIETEQKTVSDPHAHEIESRFEPKPAETSADD